MATYKQQFHSFDGRCFGPTRRSNAKKGSENNVIIYLTENRSIRHHHRLPDRYGIFNKEVYFTDLDVQLGQYRLPSKVDLEIFNNFVDANPSVVDEVSF